MTQIIWPCMSLEALIHWVGLATQRFGRLAMRLGLLIIGIIAMPVVMALNLLTKFLSTTTSIAETKR